MALSYLLSTSFEFYSGIMLITFQGWPGSAGGRQRAQERRAAARAQPWGYPWRPRSRRSACGARWAGAAHAGAFLPAGTVTVSVFCIDI